MANFEIFLSTDNKSYPIGEWDLILERNAYTSVKKKLDASKNEDSSTVIYGLNA